MAELHKIYDAHGRVDFTIRATDVGSVQSGDILWVLEYCEGDAERECADGESIDWIEGLPALIHEQWAALCMWICRVGGPGSPYQDGE